MANWKLNQLIKKQQLRTLVTVGSIALIVITTIIVLLFDAHPKHPSKTPKNFDLTGLIDESFTQEAADSAQTSQQIELESLKKQVTQLADSIHAADKEHQKALQTQTEAFKTQLNTLMDAQRSEAENKGQTQIPPELKDTTGNGLWHNPNTYAMNTQQAGMPMIASAHPTIHTVSFRPKRKQHTQNYLNSNHYVPSNTSVRAVVLGGADADASVNGQSKNNGVMLFKFLEDGTLPNGKRSRLRGCRVSANSYGDISSERAFATLYRLSCAHGGEPIIDREVTGWVFFNGKVGIKGQPLMRDNKVMTWAGISGGMAGVAQAAQYAQSIQGISPLGSTTMVPSSQIAPFAAYGGASKAADTLSQYYVKRAEQYHPVIQVGSGNIVTVVFKDGFYLEPDEKITTQHASISNQTVINESMEGETESMNFNVPPEVLGRIDSTYGQAPVNEGVTK
jgi:conjugal transfer pilus assembly protein TraB